MAPRNRRQKGAEKPYTRPEGKAEHEVDRCIFCDQPNKKDGCDEMLSGRRPNGSTFYVHYFCLLFSSGLHQRGGESEPLRGFQVPDIMKELRRGAKLKCSYCKQRNATVGCCLKMCRKVFHVFCASTNKCLLQYYDDFRAYCPEHRPLQRMTPKETGTASCLICSCDLVPEPSPDVLVTPCCKYSYHKECLQAQASNAGIHFFKCGTCNNREAFQKEMLDHGIYIPDRDASWELEDGAFQELLHRYQHCDAVRCHSRCGRDFKVDQPGDDWEILACGTCGSQGIHRACGNLSRGAGQQSSSGGCGEQSKSWICSDCRPFVKSTGTHESSDLTSVPLVGKGGSKTGVPEEASDAATKTSANCSGEATETSDQNRARPLRRQKTSQAPKPKTSKRSRSRSMSPTPLRQSRTKSQEANLPGTSRQEGSETERRRGPISLTVRKVSRSFGASQFADDKAGLQFDVVETARELCPASLTDDGPSTSMRVGARSSECGREAAMITCRNGKLCAMVKPRCSSDDVTVKDTDETTATTRKVKLGLGSPENVLQPVPTRMMQLLPPSAGAAIKKPKPKPTPKKTSGVQLSLLSYLKQFMQHGSNGKP